MSHIEDLPKPVCQECHRKRATKRVVWYTGDTSRGESLCCASCARWKLAGIRASEARTTKLHPLEDLIR